MNSVHDFRREASALVALLAVLLLAQPSQARAEREEVGGGVIYVAGVDASSSGNGSNLYWVNPHNGEAHFVGQIATNIPGCVGPLVGDLAFDDANGMLYAFTRGDDEENNPFGIYLIQIDPVTASARRVLDHNGNKIPSDANGGTYSLAWNPVDGHLWYGAWVGTPLGSVFLLHRIEGDGTVSDRGYLGLIGPNMTYGSFLSDGRFMVLGATQQQYFEAAFAYETTSFSYGYAAISGAHTWWVADPMTLDRRHNILYTTGNIDGPQQLNLTTGETIHVQPLPTSTHGVQMLSIYAMAFAR